MMMMRLLRKWIDDVLGRADYRRHLERENRGRRVRAQLFTIAGALTTLAYVLWLPFVLVADVWWLAVPFLGAEIFSLVIFISFAAVAWYPRYHRDDPDPGDVGGRVDVLVTACKEPFELVEATLRAAVAIDWPDKVVTLLDDGHDRRLESLARNLGCDYLARPNPQGAKAGNLNHGLRRTGGRFVLTLDADQVPDPVIIRRLVGYFRHPRIGFVQTRQRFIVPAGDPLASTDPVFYEVMQLGKDTANAAFSCGSGVMYRRAALEEIGGFSTWNLVEDLHTSILLHDRGWRSVYHNHALTCGTAPTDLLVAYKQRQQWAADSLRIFFWDNPFFHGGLTWSQSFHYAHIGLVYLFAGFAMPVFYVLPVVALFGGVYVLDTTLWQYFLFRAPSFILTTLAYRYFYPKQESGISFARATNTWLGYFPVFISAAWIAVRSRNRKPKYTVTPKRAHARPNRSVVLALAPQWMLLVVSLVAIPYGIVHRTATWDLLVINSVWALWTAEKMYWICLGAFAVRREGKARQGGLPGLPSARLSEMAPVREGRGTSEPASVVHRR